jgi:two-component system response regulator QseB
MRLLLVEDDPMVGEAVRAGLQGDGFVVDWVRDGAAAEAALGAHEPALVLLDLGLPKKGGLDVLRALRARRSPLPVLVITARDTVKDRIAGLDAGADDYLVKPFDLDELSARVRALLRRSAGRATSIVARGPVTLDSATREVKVHGKAVSLSAKEYLLLAALMERPGLVLSRAQLEDRIYGWGEEVSSNAVEVHVHNLRRKLGEDVIRTVRGAGYTLPDGS